MSRNSSVIRQREAANKKPVLPIPQMENSNEELYIQAKSE